MDCPSCKLNYALHTYSYYSHGMSSEGHRWIKRPSYNKAMELLENAKESKDSAIALAKTRYLGVLVAQFENHSKKAIWEVLHTNIKSYKSLVTFYQHTKGMDRTDFLSKLFNGHDLDGVMNIINVNDQEIQELRAKGGSCEKEAESLLCGD